MKRTGLLLACLVLARVSAADVVAVSDAVATVVAAEGDLRLVRDGRAVLREVDAGFAVEHFDAFTTGPSGRLELVADPRSGLAATVTAGEDTAVVVAIRFDVDGVPGVIELASGSLEVAVRAGAERSGVRVRTAALAAEAVEASFVVDLLPAAVLVTADEGIVTVTAGGQAERYASPGEAVELDPATGLVRTVRYEPEMTAAFRSAWLAGRRALLGVRADALLDAYRGDYSRARSRLDDSYAGLMRHRDVIDRWVRASMRSAEPDTDADPPSDSLRDDLDAASAAVLRYETLAASIVRVADAAGEEGTGGELLRLVETDRAIAAERAATVRHVRKLAARFAAPATR